MQDAHTVHLILDRPYSYMLWGIEVYLQYAQRTTQVFAASIHRLKAIVKIHLPSYHTRTVLVHTTR